MTEKKKTNSKVYNPTIYLSNENKRRLKHIRDDHDYRSIGEAVKLVLDVFDKACKLEEDPFGIGEVQDGATTDDTDK